MALDLDRSAKLLLQRVLQIGRDFMRLAVRHAAIELDIETYGAPAADLLNGHVMDRQPSPRRHKEHALQYRLVVECDRRRRDGEIGIGESATGRITDGFADRTHTLDRRSASNADIDLAENLCSGRPQFDVLDGFNTGDAADNSFQPVR